MDQTRRFLLEYHGNYPEAELKDYLKLLHQSAMGCEHLVSDSSAAAAWIRKEAEQCIPWHGPVLEPLDGPWYRVHLDILKTGVEAERMAELFALSASPCPNGRELLEQKLQSLMELIREGLLPFEAGEAEAALEAWKDAGYPACHHSEHFRQCYAPAYRVLRADLAEGLLKPSIENHE